MKKIILAALLQQNLYPPLFFPDHPYMGRPVPDSVPMGLIPAHDSAGRLSLLITNVKVFHGFSSQSISFTGVKFTKSAETSLYSVPSRQPLKAAAQPLP